MGARFFAARRVEELKRCLEYYKRALTPTEVLSAWLVAMSVRSFAQRSPC
jgi:hypothetical protein